jgi:putative flippase GtrA
MKVLKGMNKIVANQIIKFLIFSGAAALANIFLRIALSDLLHLNFYLAISVSYFVGMLINFLLNKNFNFPKGPRKYTQEMQTFIVIALIGLFLTNILSGFFLRIISGIHIFSSNNSKTISHILAVGVVSIYSFIGHKYFTYKKGLILKFRKV